MFGWVGGCLGGLGDVVVKRGLADGLGVGLKGCLGCLDVGWIGRGCWGV